MNEFCETCPDRKGEHCALPTNKEWRRAYRRLSLAELGNGLLAIGAAFSSARFEDSKMVLDARDNVDVMNAEVEACATLHEAISGQ